MALRYIVFDLDDTLVFNRGYLPAFVEAAQVYGISEQAASNYWNGHSGQPLAQQLSRLFDCPLDSPSVMQASEYFWSLAQEAPFEILPHTDCMLRALKSQDLLLLLSTGSNPQRVAKVLEESGWKDLFDLAQGTTQDNPKGPSHFQNIYRRLELDPEGFSRQALSVGDGPFDLRYAREQKIPFVAYVPEGTLQEKVLDIKSLQPDYQIFSHQSLPGLISKIS